MARSRSDTRIDALKQLPPLMPQFLRLRRAGLAAVGSIAEQLGIERPQLFTLIRVSLVCGSYGEVPVTYEQVKSWEPYATIDAYAEHAAWLTERGLLVQDAEGKLALSPEARQAMERLHQAGRAHVSALRPLSHDELERVASLLERAVGATLLNPLLAPQPGSHLAGSRSLVVSDPDLPVMARIEQAIYDLWLARDDAHVKAWLAAGLSGPVVAVLSEIWSGAAHTVEELAEKLSSQQTPADVERGLSYLLLHDYIVLDGDRARLTDAGKLLRDNIERETDSIYFTGWPHTTTESVWLRDKFQELVHNVQST